MVFGPPKTAGKLSPIPDSISLAEFMLTDLHGRNPLGYSQNPFTCGVTGKTYPWLDVVDRVEHLARSLSNRFDWKPNAGSEWDKTLAIFSVNTIDTLTLSWAVHRLGGVVSPANAAYSAAELKYQLQDSKATVLFTCLPLLKTALEAADAAGLSRDRIFLLEVPQQLTPGVKAPAQFKTVDQLIEAGKALPKVEALNWGPGEGARRTAFLCYSSGTSGLPKGVMVSHRNVIANVLQIKAFEQDYRDSRKDPGTQGEPTDVVMCLLPQSHIYSLVVMCHAGPWRGDKVVVLPRFELDSFLACIQDFKITSLFVVPPILINMIRNAETCAKYDLSAVKSVFTGAAPLGMETAEDFQKLYPKVTIRQGYGLTETSTVVTSTHPWDVWFGSSGTILPGVEARIVTPEGEEITSYETPGELVVRSPSVVLGYLNNDTATKETFKDGWMYTGDEAVIRLSPKKTEHVFIVDRIKELIKVKGLQVAPAELEAHLLTHPAVADCAVIAIPDDAAGEVPKAIVVKSPSATGSDEEVIQSIKKHVEDHKARHKWLKGGVRFLDVIPKSPSGKILRRLLRDQEKEARRQAGSRL
ncbi:acyl--CoA ligase [Aspergillus saccharolyticus JOP 1030-1]|uniref:Phenylacetyl-CoA ligase n=1 Tax=Aspergillus saccharolyticus JOP 1030-1 TaxID=1450539 RepID=A0A318Z8H0_9EURO|nr:phenylacetyl-CoA ligase [Aspergillus saccharolyticus JOP 1030-1]PYH41063.1 phenylacetyl-CoA ligase [Aspergillus saccharolyticus JOP 1030-1]